jgi:NAD(P)-dependent dehydrogenase (short-subunit alcohol dehydrogenase family)
VDFWGVYYCARAFLPLLIASGDGVLVNMASVAGFWPTAGAGAPISAYSTANFAIKGFSEALVEDLRANAPQVRVVLLMPGVVNTDIYVNSRRALGEPAWDQLSDAELLELLPANTRATLIEMGLLAENFSAGDLREMIPRLKGKVQDAGFVPAKAAAVILDGVRSGAWRILVGEEAEMLDEHVRANPQAPFNYEDYPEMYRPLIERALAEDSGKPDEP